MRNAEYGYYESNPITPSLREAMQKAERSVDWTDKGLAKIFRLRLLTDPGFPAWDVSYCYGMMKDGEIVSVDLPFFQLPKRKVKAAILAHARRDKVYAKGLGIFDAISSLC